MDSEKTEVSEDEIIDRVASRLRKENPNFVNANKAYPIIKEEFAGEFLTQQKLEVVIKKVMEKFCH